MEDEADFIFVSSWFQTRAIVSDCKNRKPVPKYLLTKTKESIMRAVLLLASLVSVVAGTVVGADVPQSQDSPLSQVLSKLEQQGLAPIVEVDFDDGVWEIETFRKNKPLEVHVNPQTLAILSEHPDTHHRKPSINALTASQIARQIEQTGYQPILEMDYEHGQWKVEALHAGSERALTVEAATGKILSDRADD
tara:strand:+ start:356 stop:934 length:579 start_codon:yes stop_codon:yes gene_type:complete